MRLSNFFLTFLLIAAIIVPAKAETESEAFTNRVNREYLSHWTKDQIENYFKFYQSRVPQKFIDISASKNAEAKMLFQNKQDRLFSSDTLKTVPADLVVPGEFEELKAVVVTWPYYHLDSLGNELELNFGSLGVRIQGMSYKVVTCYSYPDVETNSTLAPIFLNMINGIQKHAEVWLTVAALADSSEIQNYAAARGVELTNVKYILHDNNAFWYRDCGPVAFYYDHYNKSGLIDFEYYPGRPLDDELPAAVGAAMNMPILKSTIEYEGGNIICDGMGKLFTSNMLSQANSDDEGQYYLTSTGKLSEYTKTPITLEQCKDSIAKVMNLSKVNVLPTFVNDGGTGHVDLYADMFDENEFVFSQFPSQMSSQADYKTEKKNVDSILSIVSSMGAKYTADYIPFPRKDNGNWYNSAADYENYTRTYSNHLVVNKAIIQPIFYNETDGDKDNEIANIDSIKAAYPGYEIIPVDMRAFDGMGGSIHCITKQIPADNPIRIFHRPLTWEDYNSTNSNFTVSSIVVSNKTITAVTLFYKTENASDWKQIEMSNTKDSLWTCSLSTIGIDQNSEIDYYISATAGSINKTITKPMTAPAGYYKILTEISTGVNETANASQMQLWPNPASDEINAAFNLDNGGDCGVSLINAAGSTIYSGNISAANIGRQQINLKTSNFAAGSYILVITPANGGKITKSFIISR